MDISNSFYSASSAVAPLPPPPTPSANSTEDSTDTEMNDPDFEGQSDEEDGPITDPEKPIFERSIPGILTKEQIVAAVDLDHIKILVRDTAAETGDLVSWDKGDMGSTRSIKGIIAELVAAVGSEAARDMVVYFS
jgi:arginyl-tRNA---protein transferase